MYWKFLLLLFVASIIMPFAYTILSLPTLGVLALVYLLSGRKESFNRKRLGAYLPLMLAGGVWNFAVLSLWAAYCAGVTRLVVTRPEVTQDWFYYLTAFFLFVSPLTYMASKEEADQQSITSLWILAMSAVFVAFCIWPVLMSPAKPLLAKLPGLRSSAGRAKPSVSERSIPIESSQILRERFYLDESLHLLSEDLTQGRAREYFSRLPRYTFTRTEEQEGITVDGYLVQEPMLIARQFYYSPEKKLIGLMLVLHPDAEGYARMLAANSYESTEAGSQPPVEAARLYFLGSQRLGPEKLLKVALREDRMGETRVHSIQYILSGE